MGIPKFFRWISERYPMIMSKVDENGVPEIDNLYLDLNGLVHQGVASQAEKHTAFDEQLCMLSIFEYMDKLIYMIRPRQYLVMALDGVAPRAKMNQQRSRRFRAALDRKNAREEALRRGEEVAREDEVFDRNSITPGTEFMSRLTVYLKFYINKKIKEDRNWRNLRVIFSGHEVPGEGEHKIMEFIRRRKADPDYRPNERHCIYGLDADLIMLSLLTHEPHFVILREEVKFMFPGKKPKMKDLVLKLDRFELLHISLLREYLQLEFTEVDVPFGFDLERIIDDFVFLCFLVGNDFLPHSPTLDIGEGGIETIFRIYGSSLPNLPGYLVDGYMIHFDRVQQVLQNFIGLEQHLLDEKLAHLGSKKKFKGKKKPKRELELISDLSDAAGSDDLSSNDVEEEISLAKSLEKILNITHSDTYSSSENNLLSDSLSSFASTSGEEHRPNLAVVKPQNRSSSYQAEMFQDGWVPVNTFEKSIREDGTINFEEWRDLYYREKFGIDLSTEEGRENLEFLKFHYIEGLSWVLKYYYDGVPSWNWYYPYHYSPLLSDLTSLLPEHATNIHFEKGSPFLPFQQLMAVLPRLSHRLLPEPFRPLMVDVDSPISDFYPDSFHIDMEGKKNEWEGVSLIPFVDEQRLLRVMNQVPTAKLKPHEMKRNSHGIEFIISYDSSCNMCCESPLPRIFPRIKSTHASWKPFSFPPLSPEHKFFPRLVPGVKTGNSTIPGYPTLFRCDVRSELRANTVNVHGSLSRKPSRIIVLPETLPVFSFDRATPYVSYIGAQCMYRFPFLCEGLIDSLVDEDGTFSTKNSSHRTPHDGNGRVEFLKLCTYMHDTMLRKNGLEILQVKVIAKIRPLSSLISDASGNRSKKYEDHTIPVPMQMLLGYRDDLVIPSLRPRNAASLSERFPPGTDFVFVGERFYGCLGEVTRVHQSKIECKVLVPKEREPEFPSLATHMSVEKYAPLWKISKQIPYISPRLLGLLMSSWRVDGEDLSFNVRMKNLNMIRDRIVREVSDKDGRLQWEYSERLVSWFQEYYLLFPEVFFALTKYEENIDDITPRVMFETTCDSEEKINERFGQLCKWISDKRTMIAEEYPLVQNDGSSMLADRSIRQLESFIDEFNEGKHSSLRSMEVYHLGNVSAALIVSSADPTPHSNLKKDLRSQFSLGDRVLVANSESPVPFGTRGFIAGFFGSQVAQVVFDEAFMGGSSLQNRCGDMRGLNVSLTSLLNLSSPAYVSTQTRFEITSVSHDYSSSTSDYFDYDNGAPSTSAFDFMTISDSTCSDGDITISYASASTMREDDDADDEPPRSSVPPSHSLSSNSVSSQNRAVSARSILSSASSVTRTPSSNRGKWKRLKKDAHDRTSTVPTTDMSSNSVSSSIESTGYGSEKVLVIPMNTEQLFSKSSNSPDSSSSIPKDTNLYPSSTHSEPGEIPSSSKHPPVQLSQNRRSHASSSKRSWKGQPEWNMPEPLSSFQQPQSWQQREKLQKK